MKSLIVIYNNIINNIVFLKIIYIYIYIYIYIVKIGRAHV